MTNAESVLDALVTLFKTQIPSTTVKRNEDALEKIPSGGLIVIRDGDPGDPDVVLGGFRSCYYQHQIDVEVFVQNGDGTLRDSAFNTLVSAIGDALEADLSLGGLCQNISYGYPQANTDPVTGGAGVKSALISLIAEYETAKPIA